MKNSSWYGGAVLTLVAALGCPNSPATGDTEDTSSGESTTAAPATTAGPTTSGTGEPTTGEPPQCQDDAECDGGYACEEGVCVLPAAPLSPCPAPPLEVVTFPLGAPATGLAVLDVNGDMRNDVITAEPGSHGVNFHLSIIGNEIYYYGISSVGDPTADYSLAAGDLDGDAQPDLVVAGGAPNKVVVLANHDVSFDLTGEVATDNLMRALAVARVDGDAFSDVLAVDSAARQLVVFRGDGMGGLMPGQAIVDVVTDVGAAVLDLDGNGLADLVGAPLPAGTDLTVARGDGNGGFMLDTPLVVPPGVTRVHGSNLGGVHLAATRIEDGAGSVLAWRGQGNAAWSEPMAFSTSLPLLGGSFVDFDGDDAPDLVAATPSDSVLVLFGDDAGGFQCERSYTLPSGTAAPPLVTAADVVGSFQVELVVALADEPTLLLFSP
ncbi:FG-GAP repeat domain-containing protein [Nannocystis punicea]|uniref:VCBS repeat-containing protein n=1 Tax=Nannocystis punicea TaxID=2995304 RepID=A0ABY7HHM6_9BACT|nr:VCBS repeat-containing protein [Nannocystis poenicansa]WAS98831.1 VCBS repeat-containing protein [Nannocystis poenicansa]